VTLGTRAMVDPEAAVDSRYIVNWGSNTASRLTLEVQSAARGGIGNRHPAQSGSGWAAYIDFRSRHAMRALSTDVRDRPCSSPSSRM